MGLFDSLLRKVYLNAANKIARCRTYIYVLRSINFGKGTWDSALGIWVDYHLENQGADGRTTLKWIFRKGDWWAWTGLIWFFLILTGGGLLWMRLWTVGFHKMRGTARLAEDLSASQEGLFSMELVSWLVS